MLVNENISIEEFDNKQYQIRLIEPIHDEKAILTHYLLNMNNGVFKHYEKEALKVLDRLVKYKSEENNLIIKEEALQQLLFEVENVTFPTP